MLRNFMGKRVPLESKTIGQLKKILDKEVSIFVRNHWSSDGENVACFTCGVVKPIKSMHCGHWIPRNISPTRYEVELGNLRPQCVICNTFKAGMPHEFRRRLLDDVGAEAVATLEEMARETHKYFKPDLLEQINHYREKNKQWT